ncbi:MAG: hypothetical protein QOF76_4210, partial [Solirubrobacteraceae bacterium]|nr:hypothetical protein [Solirubrobacteraceae bacterium]
MARILALSCALLLLCAASALAVPDCPDAAPPRTIVADQGSMESIIAGPDGALYYTAAGALMRLAAPDAMPTVLTPDVEAGGGLLVGLDGKSLILGFGDSLQGGSTGNAFPMAGLYRIDLATGAKTTIVTGMSMANGLARDARGAVYGSNDITLGIDKVVAGKVTPRWSTMVSPNGLAVDSTNTYLFANQTFTASAIQRIPLADPSAAEVYARPDPGDIAAGLDGMTIDQDDRLFSAANQGGEVWRTGTDRKICALARGLKQPSAVAFGAGGPFPETSLYAVGFGGELTELAAARVAPPAPEITVAPARLRANVGRRLTVTVIRQNLP